MEKRHITRSHNKTRLVYHFVCPIKYRRDVLADGVAQTLKEICLEIQARFDIHFLEIGTDEDHVHFLIQTVPTASPSSVIQNIKSNIGRELFKQRPEIKRMLWGGKFWSAGFYANTVGEHTEDVIRNYVHNQGKRYERHYQGQPTLFDGVA